jgi:hypothetical protein
MKSLRVLVLVHPSLMPPDSVEGYTAQQIDDWRTEYDVITTLRAVGHEVRCLGVLDSLTELRTAITEWKPDVVFNLLEEFNGIVTYDQHVVAFLELMEQPYTGCNPRGLLLSRDKPLCKQLLAYHRIPTAQFAVLRRGIKFRVPPRLRYPLFVKSAKAAAQHAEAKLKVRVLAAGDFFVVFRSRAADSASRRLRGRPSRHTFSDTRAACLRREIAQQRISAACLGQTTNRAANQAGFDFFGRSLRPIRRRKPLLEHFNRRSDRLCAERWRSDIVKRRAKFGRAKSARAQRRRRQSPHAKCSAC